jgi:hypothetical protein
MVGQNHGLPRSEPDRKKFAADIVSHSHKFERHETEVREECLVPEGSFSALFFVFVAFREGSLVKAIDREIDLWDPNVRTDELNHARLSQPKKELTVKLTFECSGVADPMQYVGPRDPPPHSGENRGSF